ncbi:MAG: hypothetical protein ONB11_02895, partial [candidate division KSB1 bacterium]|nr:hypothetical protein [candidate division KSB1 bacterium]
KVAESQVFFRLPGKTLVIDKRSNIFIQEIIPQTTHSLTLSIPLAFSCMVFANGPFSLSAQKPGQDSL